MADRYHELLEEIATEMREADIEAFVKLGQGHIPDQLYITLPEDDKGRVLHVQLLFLPGDLDVPVLQTYAGLPYEIEPDAVDALCRFLAAVNVNVPVGGLGYAEGPGLLYYRYNAAIAVDPLDADVVGWSIATAGYVIERFGPLVETVAAGGALDDALTDLEEVIAADAAASN